MTSNSRIETTSRGYGNSIHSLTDATSGGDTPHAEYIAGMTAGEIGKGHSMAHADYLSRTKMMEVYTGRSDESPPENSSQGSGLGGLKDLIGVMKSLSGL